jgi:PAS domain S-box-containing protein
LTAGSSDARLRAGDRDRSLDGRERAVRTAEVQAGFADAELQERLLGEAFEHAPVATVVLDEHGRFLAANRAACDLTGYTREELLALGTAGLAVASEIEDRLREIAAGERTVGREELRRKDGTVVEVVYRTGETRVSGLPFYVAVFWRDD